MAKKEEIQKGPEKLSDEQVREIGERLKKADKVANALDKYQLDPIIGLFEGGGDAVTAVAGLYIVYQAKKAGLPPWEIVKMMGRIGIDFAVGSLPVVGDIADFLYRSNKKNAVTFREYYEKEIVKRFEELDNPDLIRGQETLLAEEDRLREKKDLRGLKKKVNRYKRAA